MYGSIDAGGTTFKCAVADDAGRIVRRHRVATTTPEDTIAQCAAFFRDTEGQGPALLARLGLAAFGPLDVDPNSPTYGAVLDTPKPGWSHIDLKGRLEDALGAAVRVDTDVNAALLAELHGGAAKDAARAAYVTVGTGIGAGFVQDGALIAKPHHPEFGHIPVERHPNDTFEGACPFHGACLEGMASATAFEMRWGAAQNVDRHHEAWTIEADYLAQACLAISLFLRPDRIILGGGLMLAEDLIAKVRAAYAVRMGGYLNQTQGAIEALITRPAYGDDAGLMGGFWLARQG